MPRKKTTEEFIQDNNIALVRIRYDEDIEEKLDSMFK